MARKYQVSVEIPVQQTGVNTSSLEIDEMVDLAKLLSQRLQTNVRQGKVFHLHEVKAMVRPVTDGEYDLGVSCVGEIFHCPATRNSVRAWKHLFSTWRKQKALKVGAIGPTVRNDDFEIGWNNDHYTSRTSSILASGMGDTQSEDVVIYGSSSTGGRITLQDTFESLQPLHSPSRFPIGNAVVKDAKYTVTFPQAVKTPFTCHWSAKHSDNNTPTLDWVNVASGATGHVGVTEIFDSATLAGVLRVRGFVGAGDDATTSPDEAILSLTFTVSQGTPLAGGSSKRSKR